jgi:hypothetical protein
MQLSPGGIDVFYIDESQDQKMYVMSAVAIPFMRRVKGVWTITWPDHLDAAKTWRRSLNASIKIPTAKELHGNKLVSGRGNYLQGRYQFPRPKATAIYRAVLQSLSAVVPPSSILTAAARRGSSQLYGRTRLEACLYALLQRMRTQCSRRQTNAIVFFDAGHPEYRKLYRQAQIYLPTGSSMGGWSSGSSQNLPLDMFTKDGNEKDSKFCFFTQIADLVAFAALLKVKAAFNELEPWQASYNLGTLYDEIPKASINLAATNRAPRDGIVRLF